MLGLPFHNPYAFLPFPEQAIERHPVTWLTADELPAGESDEQRLTGILELRITTETPLLTCHPEPLDDRQSAAGSQSGQGRERGGRRREASHKRYAALAIGRDVIVPATGVRGSLRTLLTVLTGGTLGYINQHAYACQGRDPSANLGPRGLSSPPSTPANVFLAEVVQPGHVYRDGSVRLGTTRLVRLEALERCNGGRRFSQERDPGAPALWVELDEQDQPCSISTVKDEQKGQWKLKLSGRPVNPYNKREGLFRASGPEIALPAELWASYSERNVHGARRELKKGDLVWLEPVDPDCVAITSADQVKSLQWARWGRHGQPLRSLVPPDVLPDSMRAGGQVDAVTNLFGQVPERGVDTQAFAARVRTENLVLRDAAAKVQRNVTLAPLAPPHPGCMAFYRQNANADDISESDPLRGYKVYRVQQPGQEPPWLFLSQGVYDKQGRLHRDPRQKVNKTVDLVPAGTQGTLRISFRALTRRELALLLMACSVPWRLGGGKPLGLGLCRVDVLNLLGEDGERLQVPGWEVTDTGDQLRVDGWQSEVDQYQRRVVMWEASQMPVPLLRYPRAVERTNQGITRGGHSWFQRHALPRKTAQRGDTARQPGLEPMYIEGPLLEAVRKDGQEVDPRLPMISGQLLPPFNQDQPLADPLYGFDGYNVESQERDRKKFVRRLEGFDPTRHAPDPP
ncbi:MAG: hypothetical protein J5I93_02680 [Pirellulaceae bacterium]|nr:hypothetical protein [Pirellulaceae bacterium]